MKVKPKPDRENCTGYKEKSQVNMNNILEDWRMTKDRIKHFDDVTMRTRLQGIPIATGLQAAGFALSGELIKIDSPLPIFSLVMLASVVYIIPIFFLDMFHLRLLNNAVNHSLCLEKKYFDGEISITRILTSKYLSKLHKIGGSLVYIIIMGIGIGFTIYGFQNPNILS